MPRRRRHQRTPRPVVVVNRYKVDVFKSTQLNNRALAKALAKEKNITQDLRSSNLLLTEQIDELINANNAREKVISSVLNKAKCAMDSLATMRYAECAMDSLVTMSGHLGNIMALCQQVPSALKLFMRYTLRVSDIQEFSSPRQNPSNASPTNAPAPPGSPNYQENRRSHRRSSHVRDSIRFSGENERRSSPRANRKSGRHSSNFTRRSSGSPRRSTAIHAPETHYDERLCSPRVALHDVSRLLQNSPTNNIRTWSGNSTCEPEARKSEENRLNETIPIVRCSIEPERKSTPAQKKNRDPLDRLEGPSWLYDCETTLPLENAKEHDEERAERIFEDRQNNAPESGDNSDENEPNEMDGDLPAFVIRKRGSDFDESTDFSLLWRKEKNDSDPDLTEILLSIPTKHLSNSSYDSPPRGETVIVQPPKEDESSEEDETTYFRILKKHNTKHSKGISDTSSGSSDILSSPKRRHSPKKKHQKTEKKRRSPKLYESDSERSDRSSTPSNPS